MSTTITETDTYPATISVPENGEAGDEAAFALAPGGLTNRTHYLKNRQDERAQWALIAVSGSSVATSASFTLALSDSNGAGWAVASNAVTVPAVGVYEVTISIRGRNDSTSTGARFSSVVYLNGASTGFVTRGVRYSTTAADDIAATLPQMPLRVTDVAHTISLVNEALNDLTIPTASFMYIKRIA